MGKRHRVNIHLYRTPDKGEAYSQCNRSADTETVHHEILLYGDNHLEVSVSRWAFLACASHVRQIPLSGFDGFPPEKLAHSSMYYDTCART